jgi:hypothetical protein
MTEGEDTRRDIVTNKSMIINNVKKGNHYKIRLKKFTIFTNIKHFKKQNITKVKFMEIIFFFRTCLWKEFRVLCLVHGQVTEYTLDAFVAYNVRKRNVHTIVTQLHQHRGTAMRTK